MSDLSSPEGSLLAENYRREFANNGLCILPNFVLPNALDILTKEANQLIDQAFFFDSVHNVYLTNPNSDLSSGDIVNRQEETYVGSIAYDEIDTASLLRYLYLWDPLKEFLRTVLNKDQLYRFADPLGACSINVFTEGGRHGWHFDESEFSVTLMLQESNDGGHFEFVPKIRGLRSEKKILNGLLDGDQQNIIKLPFVPGTLSIFGGQKTIHRVTQVKGSTPRLVSVFCYAEKPNLVNSASVQEMFWGRTC